MNISRYDTQRSYATSNGLQQHPSRSRSVPEGLGCIPQSNHGCECQFSRGRSSTICRSSRPIHVVEQITTSVWPKINFKIVVLVYYSIYQFRL